MRLNFIKKITFFTFILFLIYELLFLFYTVSLLKNNKNTIFETIYFYNHSYKNKIQTTPINSIYSNYALEKELGIIQKIEIRSFLNKKKNYQTVFFDNSIFSNGIPVISIIIRNKELHKVSKNPGLLIPSENLLINPNYLNLTSDPFALIKVDELLRFENKKKHKASIEYFYSNNYIRKNGLIKIKGSGSSILPQLSFKVIEDKKYYLFSSGFDQFKTLIKQKLILDLASHSTLKRCNTNWVNVLLNGNYYGIYLMESTLKNCINKNISKIFDSDKNKTANSEFYNLVNELEKTPKNLEKYFILDELFDYFIFQFYFHNQNWPQRNCIFYYSNNKWHPYLKDFDSTFNDYDLVKKLDLVYNSKSPSGLIFKAIIDDEKLKFLFNKRVTYVLRNILNQKIINSKIEDLKGILEPSIDLQINRWKGIKNKEDWYKNVEGLKFFCLQKNETFETSLKRFYGNNPQN